VFIAVAPEQDDAPHGLSAGYTEHEPNPSQVPVVPQVEAACAAHIGWVRPAGTGWQVPSLPTKSHLLHSPSQEVLQQTPSAQCVDAHSLSASQTAPFILGPQLPFTHFRPTTQSASLLHLLKHWFLAASQE
jgi:hypothetical protein